jgi:hypothetical protein
MPTVIPIVAAHLIRPRFATNFKSGGKRIARSQTMTYPQCAHGSFQKR